jgi:hypothetical protein
MAGTIEYRGFEITKSGRSSWDYTCTFVESGAPRTRWGTLAEIKTDCDSVAEGIGLPPKDRGFA